MQVTGTTTAAGTPSTQAHGAAPPAAAVVAVVLVHERMGYVADCVRALGASRGVSLHSIVVDGGSSATGRASLVAALATVHLPTAATAAVPGVGPLVLVRTETNLGYAGGNNVGIAAALDAGARHVLVLNDDTVIAEDAVARLVAALDADPGAAAASPSILYAGTPARVWWAGGTLDRWRALGRHETGTAALAGPPRAVGCLCGCAVLFRAEALRAVGAFAADFFMYVEDVEWSVRATRAGWRLLHVPEAHLVHRVPYPEPAPAAWKVRLRDRNRRRLARRHFSPRERLCFALWFYPTRLLLLLGHLLRGDVARAAAIGRGMIEE